MALNDSQKRALEVQLRNLEQVLYRVGHRIRERPEEGLLTHHIPIPETVRRRFEALIKQMHEELAVLIRQFELQPKAVDSRSYVNATMALTWSSLNEVLSSKLKRYGEVDPALSESLDPCLNRLIDLALQVAEVAREGK
ncbi:MAG: hypothetical protein LJE87_15405 [Deltaproteobacteria bacterium]|jgi:hypothetical protein|nr:hypothetical protein [Deltaproteobacteria bacterium]